jgi:hypothetical protein
MKGVSQSVVAAVALLAVLVVLINPETIGLDVARDGKLIRVLVLLWVLAAIITTMVTRLISAAHRTVVAFVEPASTVSDFRSPLPHLHSPLLTLHSLFSN